MSFAALLVMFETLYAVLQDGNVFAGSDFGILFLNSIKYIIGFKNRSLTTVRLMFASIARMPTLWRGK